MSTRSQYVRTDWYPGTTVGTIPLRLRNKSDITKTLFRLQNKNDIPTISAHFRRFQPEIIFAETWCTTPLSWHTAMKVVPIAATASCLYQNQYNRACFPLNLITRAYLCLVMYLFSGCGCVVVVRHDGGADRLPSRQLRLFYAIINVFLIAY